MALWRVPHVLGRGRWKSQHRKIVPLSPYVEKPLNSKLIKSFVPELRSRKSFSCFGIPMFYVYMLRTFYVRFAYSCMAMLQTDYMCRDKKEEEESPDFKIVSMWINSTTRRQRNKTLMKTDYSHQKQYRQHKHQHNKNNQETKTGRKTVWTFQATNKRNLSRENLDVAKKWKP